MLLGMHRSGTSLCAQVLAAAGLPMGPALMTETVGDNKQGYWEDREIVDQQQRCLAEIAGPGRDVWSADFLDALDSIDDELARRHADALAAILERRFTDSPVFGFKDPRSPSLLNIWKQVAAATGAELVPVLLVRRPGEVRESLARRQGLSPELGELFWLRSLLDCLRAFDRDLPVIPYEAWFNHAGAAARFLASLFASLGLPEPAIPLLARWSLRNHAEDAAILPIAENVYAAIARDGAPTRLDAAKAQELSAAIAAFIGGFGGWSPTAALLGPGFRRHSLPRRLRLPLPGGDFDHADLDPRAGQVRLLNANQWCRALRGSFQLHANPGTEPPAGVRWTGIRLSGPAELRGELAVWSRKAVPLFAVIRTSLDEAPPRELVLKLAAGEKRAFSYPLPSGSANLLDITLSLVPEDPSIRPSNGAAVLRNWVISFEGGDPAPPNAVHDL